MVRQRPRNQFARDRQQSRNQGGGIIGPNYRRVVPPRFRDDQQGFNDWVAKHGDRYRARFNANAPGMKPVGADQIWKLSGLGGRPRPDEPPITDQFPRGDNYDTGWNNGLQNGRPAPDGPPTTDQAQTGRILDPMTGRWVDVDTPYGKVLRQQQNQSDRWEQNFGVRPDENGVMHRGQYFNAQEWQALPPEMFVQNVQTLLSNPGARQYLPEDAYAQIAQIAASRGIPLPPGFAQLSQPSPSVRPTPGGARPGVLPPATAAASAAGVGASSMPVGTPTGQATVPGAAPAGFNASAINYPLDPQFEAQRRILEDSLQAQLAPLAGQRENIAAQDQLARARLATNRGIDEQNLLDQLAARGVFNSSLRAQGQGDLATQYLRSGQDLAQDIASAYGNVSQNEADAYLNYNQGLADILNDWYNREANDPYSSYGAPPAQGNGRRWRPQWKPTWKPTWQPGGN